MVRFGCLLTVIRKPHYCLMALSLVVLMCAVPARAFNYVTDANGTFWGIQDAASPRADTGSIRATQTGRGDCLFTACLAPPYRTTTNGFAGIEFLGHASTDPPLN